MRIAGKRPSGAHLLKIKSSPNYKNGAFRNLTETPMAAEDASYWKMLRNFFARNELKSPRLPVPSVKTDLQQLGNAASFTWFGHSSYLLRINAKNILVDPVFSGHAAPVNFMVGAFPGSDIYRPADMPPIDCLVITHDHYDHLDYHTVLALKGKVKKVVCSLGVGSHLRYWGYDPAAIVELDWWEQAMVSDQITLTAAPARHFSGRGLTRGQTFWSSFALQAPDMRIYIGGDSGYEEHFAAIGKYFGGFDFAILECGQYNKMWPYIHMMPEETVQASIDLKAQALIPVHWGKFQLAMHAWNEPVIRAKARASELGVDMRVAKIGQPMGLQEPSALVEWWLA